MITLEQIQYLCPKNKNPKDLTTFLNAILPKYDINTKERIACFLAQVIHESSQFTALKENLNYSAQGLCATWAKRFPTMASAKPYSRSPEKIANLVYCDRMGNGSEASGDGWKYRGRGAIMLTGKDNYNKFAKSIGKSLDDTVAYCETLEGALESGCWFWSINNLNRLVDAGNFTGLTRAINGGENGLSARKEIYNIVIQMI